MSLHNAISCSSFYAAFEHLTTTSRAASLVRCWARPPEPSIPRQAMLNSANPWHHVANVPFQILCILLAIDTPSSISQLADAVKTLSNVAQIYDRNAAKEALNTSCLFVRIHQKRKDTDVKSLAAILRTYSPSPFVETQIAGGSYGNGAELNVLNEPSWLDELMTDIPSLQCFDVGQLLDDSSRLDLPAQWV